MSRKRLPAEGLGLRSARIIADGGRTALLRELVQSGLTDAAALSAIEGYPAAVKSFKSSLADLLWHIASGLEDSRDVLQPLSAARALHIFRQAREYIHE